MPPIWEKTCAFALAFSISLASMAWAVEGERAIMALSRMAELLVVTAPGCQPCPEQVAYAQAVADRYGYRVRTVDLSDLSTRTVPTTLFAMLEPLRPTLGGKTPVVFVAVPALPALLPIVSSSSLPHSADELSERLGIVADLAYAQ
ncbi:MAG: hypothetical protein AB1411_02575 [Nitrospirota bacterium]